MSETGLVLISGSHTLDLDDKTNYIHLGHSGIAMPPLHRLSSRSTNQHGVTDRGCRLDPRVINLALAIRADTWTQHFTKRDTLLRMLTPAGDDPLKLRFTLPDGSLRQIDCYYDTGLDLPTNDIIGTSTRVGFSLLCPDPAFYDPVANTAIAWLHTGTDEGAVPTAVPTPIGAGINELNENIGIVYGGSWYSEPVIRIAGPITDPVVENTTTDKKIDFTGITIAAGQYYVIDCRWGYKTVVNGSDVNKFAELTDDSDLSSFTIEPDPSGWTNYNNSINVSGSACGGTTRVDITYFTRYAGL